VTVPGRPPDVSALTSGELERTRRELAASLALTRPGSAARVPIQAHLTAIDTELARRAPAQPHGLHGSPSAAATPSQDSTLLDELPYLAGQLDNTPAGLLDSLLDALDIQVLYRPEQHQATIYATLTGTTPATITALLADPRTGITHTTQPGTPAPNPELAQGPYSSQNWPRS
jgi:hypothetical protein